FLAAGRGPCGKAFLREELAQGLSGGLIVFDDEDRIATGAWQAEAGCRSRLGFLRANFLHFSLALRHERLQPDREGGADPPAAAPRGRSGGPDPSRLCTRTAPPMASQKWWGVAGPSPGPPKRRFAGGSTCGEGLNNFLRCSGVMPMPVSMTRKVNQLPSHS